MRQGRQSVPTNIANARMLRLLPLLTAEITAVLVVIQMYAVAEKLQPVESICILLGTNYRHKMTRPLQNQNHSPCLPNKDCSRRKSPRKRLPPNFVKPTHHGNVYMAGRSTEKKGCPSPINMGKTKGDPAWSKLRTSCICSG